MTTTEKTPIDLHTAVQERLAKITFLAPLRLKDVPRAKCDALGEGTSASYSQGISLNESVAVFLDHWGWARPHNRYSLAVFERHGKGWSQVRSRIEDINVAIAIAIHTLAEHALSGSEPSS